MRLQSGSRIQFSVMRFCGFLPLLLGTINGCGDPGMTLPTPSSTDAPQNDHSFSMGSGGLAEMPGLAGGASGNGGDAGGTGGTETPSGDSQEAPGRLVGATCYPVCTSSLSDEDGDGWGWENEASCLISDSTPFNTATSECSISTSEGSGGGSNSGTGGGNSIFDCDVEPANPNTNATARRVLCFLYEVYGKNTLSGQQDCHFSASSDLQYIFDRAGVYPAVVGGDFLYENAVPQATSAWNAGSLPMIRYHMGRPEDQDSYQSSLGTTDLADTLTPGTARHQGLMSKFSHAASELQKLKDAGVVVIWAPFHEVQPGGWFWWSKGSGQQLQQLWRLMFEDFQDRGLDNLIWLFPFSGNPSSEFFPGSEWVDLAGPDTYTSGQPFSGIYQNSVSVVGSQIPIPLHETGVLPDPGAMFNNNQAPWLLFSNWCDTFLRSNSDATIYSVYNHFRTLNRGDLPVFD